MRLTRIKLAGFKSFVDATTIQFPSNLVGVVGPNGCGKSNVIDAIRWVLGESSAKTLRGQSMTDVIFNGSSGRKPVSQASIELVFDNSDGTVGGAYAQYAELAVRRVLARDGTSQYYLNGGRCRRKDITNILLGTGLGANGYSIIEQGTISRVVEAKPAELRAFLEEAAGISKYKERRRETEHRIRHTRENLERLGDLRDELDKQLAHLKRQATAAERYKEFKSEERRLHAESLALRLAALRAELDEQDSGLGEKQEALEQALEAQRGLETDAEQLRATLGERNEALNGVQEDYYRVGAEIARLEQAIQHRRDLIQRQSEDLTATDQQLEEIHSHIASDEQALEQLDEVLEALSPELDQAQEAQAASEAHQSEAEAAMEAWRERFDAAARELSEVESTARVEEARVEQLGSQSDRVLREYEKQRTERTQLSTRETEDKVEEWTARQRSLAVACTEAAEALDAAWREIQQLRERDRELSAEVHQAREALQNDRGRLASLEALQEAAIGKKGEQLSKWLADTPLADRRSLGERLVVDAGWDRAVETVLGSYLQAVSIETLDLVAGRLPELSEGGLALFEEHPASATANAAFNGTTASGLADHVSEPVAARSLLAGVRTADTLEAAMALRAQLGANESVITPAGVWLGADWLRINRSDDSEVGVIARGEEIARLRERIATSSARVEEAVNALADTRARLEELEATRKSAQEESNSQQQLLADAKMKLESARTELEQIRKRGVVLDQRLEELETERQNIDAKLEQCRGRRDEAARQLELLSETRHRLEQEREQHQAMVTEARSAAERDRKTAHELALKLESRRNSKESASAALTRVQAQQQHLTQRGDELRERLAGATEPLAGDETLLNEQAETRAGVNVALETARALARETEQQLHGLDEQRNNTGQRVNDAREAADSARLRVREAQVRSETVSEQFAETGFELDTVLAELPDDADQHAWQESLERLERKIQRLGAINLAAIDEFKEQAERKEYLDSQHEDLSGALKTLEDAIHKIDRETRSRFKETYEHANQGLQQLFPRLFGGGSAYLALDCEDLLEAGVTIMARPPGKRNSSIHLLSGGEKALTAVALVFSIFELNPAPFCLLDEVDAPLDDANVGRFNAIVREMSEQVQFVIITHNKTTMETMHQLAGVTMHEPGVSRLVAVDLDQAVQLAAM